MKRRSFIKLVSIIPFMGIFAQAREEELRVKELKPLGWQSSNMAIKSGDIITIGDIKQEFKVI